MSESGSRRAWRCTPGSVGRLVQQLRDQGGQVQGGPSEGQLTASTPLGSIEGRYAYDGETLTVTITARPALVPLELIWDRLDRLCGAPVNEA